MPLNPASYDPQAHRAAREIAKHGFAGTNKSLAALKCQWAGTEYRFLVQEHIHKTGAQLQAAVLGEVMALDKDEGAIVEMMIDDYNARGYVAEFWQQHCGDVLEDIGETFAGRMRLIGRDAEDWQKFTVFQIITMNFAQMAYEQPALCEFLKISRERFKWGAGPYAPGTPSIAYYALPLGVGIAYGLFPQTGFVYHWSIDILVFSFGFALVMLMSKSWLYRQTVLNCERSGVRFTAGKFLLAHTSWIGMEAFLSTLVVRGIRALF